METVEARVVVIGAGMAGASAAAELARDRSVVLLEMEEQPGFHTTGRSAALFDETYGNATVRALTRASRAFLEAPPAGFCEQPLLTPRGLMMIARADQREQLAHLERTINGTGGQLRRVSAGAARARVPALRDGYVAEALLDEGVRDVDVHALHQAWLRQLRRLGGTLCCSAPVDAIERAGDRLRVLAGGRAFVAEVVVNAAGAWCDRVASLAGAAPVGLRPLRRTVLIVEAPAGVAVTGWPLVMDADERFYFKPDAGRILVTPCDETPSPPCDARPEETDVAIAVDRFQAACDVRVDRVSHRWAGLRSFVADRTPVVGFDPGVPGLFWLAGQGGYGIGTSPSLARTAAALVRGEPLPDEVLAEGVGVADLTPARAALRG